MATENHPPKDFPASTAKELRLSFIAKKGITKNVDIYVRSSPDDTLIGLIHCSKIDNEYFYYPLKETFVQYTAHVLKTLSEVLESANNNLKT